MGGSLLQFPLSDNTVTGFCTQRINYTMARVISTTFVRVEVQSKEVSDQSTTFVQNTCQPMNRRLVGPILAQCSTSGQPDRQWFNATIQCDFSLNRTTNGAVINVTSAGAATLVNISLDSKL